MAEYDFGELRFKLRLYLHATHDIFARPTQSTQDALMSLSKSFSIWMRTIIGKLHAMQSNSEQKPGYSLPVSLF